MNALGNGKRSMADTLPGNVVSLEIPAIGAESVLRWTRAAIRQ